jgi:hypothetical protein
MILDALGITTVQSRQFPYQPHKLKQYRKPHFSATDFVTSSCFTSNVIPMPLTPVLGKRAYTEVRMRFYVIPDKQLNNKV